MTDRAETFVRLLREQARERRARYQAGRSRAALRLAAADASAREAANQRAYEIATLHERLATAERVAEERQSALDALMASTSWRMTAPLRAIIAQLRGPPRTASASPEAGTDDDDALYRRWIERFDTLTSNDRRAIRRHVESGELNTPMVVIRFDAPAQGYAGAVLDGLRRQIMPPSRAILCFGEGCDPALVNRMGVDDDDRIMMIQMPLSPSMREALHDFGSPDTVVVASGTVIFREETLYGFAAAAQPASRLIYADEDRLEHRSRRAPWFKPCFSPELLRKSSYFGGCAMLRGGISDMTALIEQVFATADVPRFLAAWMQPLPADAVLHIPNILFHETAAPVLTGTDPARSDAHGEVTPRVSIIIPTRDHADLLTACLTSITDVTAYPRSEFEIVVIDNGSTEPAALRLLAAASADGRIRLIRDARPFNFPRMNNEAARTCGGDILVFLNNDTRINQPDWLHRLVGFANQLEIGAVGAKLLYPDGTVQHGGMIIGFKGSAGHAHVGIGGDDPGYQGLATLTREVAAVTGACLAIRRDVFQELGGFDETLAVAFNDVLLCLEALGRGYRNILVSEPLVTHVESKTRGVDDTAEKRALFRREALYVRSRHPAIFREDPYYNPNLSLETAYALACPPRRVKPWRRFERRTGSPARVLLLGDPLEAGTGVATLLDQQSAFLVDKGFQVCIGDPTTIGGPADAACFAFEHDIDCIVALTQSYFAIAPWLGARCGTIMCDAEVPDPAARAEALWHFAMADRIWPVQLGNSHLPTWTEQMRERRSAARSALGLGEKVLVLTVCDRRIAGRGIDGIETYATAADEFRLSHPDLSGTMIFAVVVGDLAASDAADLEDFGLRVFACPPACDVTDLYAAADVCVSCARSVMYDEAIAQALAFGLPVIGSDVPAHRTFPITLADDPEEIVARLEQIADALPPPDAPRTPVVVSWDDALAELAEAIAELC